MSLGRFGVAEPALRRAASLASDDAQAWANLAALYGTTGRIPEARRAYAKALALDPANADAKEGMRLLEHVGPRGNPP